MAEVVVQTVPRHAQVESIDAVQRILILFKLIRRHDDVVTTQQIQACTFVVRNQAIADNDTMLG